MKTIPQVLQRATMMAALLIPCAAIKAQISQDRGASPATSIAADDEVIVLSPFEVSSSNSNSYNASTTLAGNRLNTQLRDVGSAVTVVTSQFLRDTGAVNNSSLLQYTPSSEVGGVYGNFAGTGDGAVLSEPTTRPNENTRIRGLAAADNTRDFFRTDIPWDGYNTDRVDIQRGPNSILFGQGSPAGIINAGTKVASFRNSGEVEFRYGSYGSTRASLDVNQVLVPGQVAFRLDGLYDRQKFQQDPAYSKDQRLSGAIRIDPEFLRKNGNRTIFKANFENGKIDSNNPRELPPVDNITPWFTAMNQRQLSGWNDFDHLSGRPFHGASRAPADFADQTLAKYSDPWVRNAGFGNSAGRNPTAFFSGNGAPTYNILSVPQELQGNAIVPGSIGGLAVAPGYWSGVASTSTWAINTNQPYSAGGIFKNNLITDPSIFDFYNKLIDGDTKKEWQRFDTATFNLAQTFLDDQAGFSLDYNKEHYESGQTALFGGSVGLFVDPMKIFNNGTPDVGATPGVEPYSDGTPNPNLGRPFVSSNGQNNNSFASDRESKRATGFVTHDFSKANRSWLGRILGIQTLTGLASDDQQKTDSRAWQRYAYLDPSTYAIEQLNYNTTNFANGAIVPTQIIYLGGSLLGKSIGGANIPGVSGNPTIGNGQLTYFNDHWNKPTNPADPGYVNPAAPWINNAYTAATPARYNALQSDNPANFVGWTTAPLNVTDSEAKYGNRDLLTTFAGLTKSATTSQALVWQGKMLDDSIVGTYGWRKDINKSWAVTKTLGNGPNGRIDFNDYELPSNADARVEVQSRSYSIVAHLMDLPGLKNWTKNLPFEISLAYNVSTNFKPDSSRVDVAGNSLASPSGKTIDRGIVIETRDHKYSLRVNRYVTSVKDATGANSGAFGNNLGTFMGYNAMWTNIFDYGIGNGYFDTTTTPRSEWYHTGPFQRYTFATAGSELVTPETIADQAASVAGMRAFETEVDKALPNFWKAWGYTSLANVQSGAPIPNAVNGQVLVPNGFSITEDSVSKGWEIELNAQPTKNWRLTLNASKSEAVRSNIGGEALNKLMNIIVKDMQGPAGQLHYWWGTADVPRAGVAYYNDGTFANLGAQWAGRKLLEGTNVPELREWRVNLISNYDVTTGFLRGVNYGGGLRYQSSVGIGYAPTGDPLLPATYGYDLSNPYMAPSETNFDFWVGYSRQLSRKINWHVQLNVRNAFQGDDLIPITVQGPIPGQPPGTPAGYRIAPSQTWTITNTFSF